MGKVFLLLIILFGVSCQTIIIEPSLLSKFDVSPRNANGWVPMSPETRADFGLTANNAYTAQFEMWEMISADGAEIPSFQSFLGKLERLPLLVVSLNELVNTVVVKIEGQKSSSQQLLYANGIGPIYQGGPTGGGVLIVLSDKLIIGDRLVKFILFTRNVSEVPHALFYDEDGALVADANLWD